MASGQAKGVRRIVVDGQPYIWTLSGGFRAFATDIRTSPLQIFIPNEWSSCGRPHIPGHVEEGWQINLYTPVWAATLIRYGLAKGWEPNVPNKPFTIDDGFAVFAELDFKPTG